MEVSAEEEEELAEHLRGLGISLAKLSPALEAINQNAMKILLSKLHSKLRCSFSIESY